jgi:hypothetical protein
MHQLCSRRRRNDDPFRPDRPIPAHQLHAVQHLLALPVEQRRQLWYVLLLLEPAALTAPLLICLTPHRRCCCCAGALRAPCRCNNIIDMFLI